MDGSEFDGDLDRDLDLVSVGGAMPDRYYRLSNLPDPDGGSFVRESWWDFGGAAANVAVGTARLGRAVGMVTRLGTDDGGQGYERAAAVLENLEASGIDTDRVRRGEETGTYSMILAGPDGRRMVVTGGESVKSLRLADPDWPYLRSASAVFTNAYAPDPVVAPMVEARAEGAFPPLAFDLSGPLPELADRGVRPETIDAMVSAGDLFVAGEVALRSYCDHHGIPADTDAVVGHLRDLGVSRAALTRGPDGATLVTPDRTVSVGAFDVDVVDETGAGDAFIAGLIDAWVLDDRPPAEAGRFAAAAGALNCTGEGASGGISDREQVQAFLADRTS